MEHDPLDLPTSPSLPSLPVMPSQPHWPDQGSDQPPRRRPSWPLLAVLGAGLAVVVILALLLTLLLTTRGGTTTVLLGAAEQTATSAQANSTAEGTPPTSPTSPVGTGGGNGPGATATPHGAATATATPQTSLSINSVSAQARVTTGTPVSVSCPTGELALSGGWRSTPSAPVTISNRNGGAAGNGWRVFPISPSGATVTVFALCLQHATGASIVERSLQINVGAGAGANGAVSATAPCTGGEIPVGGGFANPVPGVKVLGVDLSGDQHGIVGSVYNTTSVPHSVTIYAECLSASGLRLGEHPSLSQSVGAGASGSIQLACTGSLLAGGGFFTPSGGLIVDEFWPSPNGGTTDWRLSVSNEYSASAPYSLHALCLSVS